MTDVDLSEPGKHDVAVLNIRGQISRVIRVRRIGLPVTKRDSLGGVIDCRLNDEVSTQDLDRPGCSIPGGQESRNLSKVLGTIMKILLSWYDGGISCPSKKTPDIIHRNSTIPFSQVVK